MSPLHHIWPQVAADHSVPATPVLVSPRPPPLRPSFQPLRPSPFPSSRPSPPPPSPHLPPFWPFSFPWPSSPRLWHPHLRSLCSQFTRVRKCMKLTMICVSCLVCCGYTTSNLGCGARTFGRRAQGAGSILRCAARCGGVTTR